MSELFLAEAAVRVRADTAGFRAALLAEVEASVKAAEAIANVRITPIAAAATGAGAAAGAAETAAAAKLATTAIEQETVATKSLSVAQGEQSASTVAAAAASQQLNIANREQTALSASIARATSKVAAAQEEIVGASSAAAAAQIHFTRVQASSASVSAAAQKLLNRAFVTGNVAATDLAVQMRLLAVVEEQQALAALNSARANTAQAATFSQASRGAASTLLTMVGLRGATLAATGPFIAAAASAIAFTKALSLAASLQKELNVFQATAGATADQMQRVSEAAKALGSDITLPAVSAGDAATTMTELAKAGLSVEDSINGARGALLLATAANLDNERSVAIVANALNSFGLQGIDAAHVADLLANASIQAQGSIGDMGDALTNVAPVARQVGISLDDTVNLLTLLARNGIQGGNAGTVLRVALLRLVAPSSAARKELEGLNVALRDASGRVRPQVFADIATALDKLSGRRRAEALTTIFGERGIRGAAILGREGTAALNSVAAGNERAGAAAELAGAQTEGFSGSLENMKNQLSEVGVELGDLVIGPLAAFINSSSQVVGATATIISELHKLGSEAVSVGEQVAGVNLNPFGNTTVGDIARQIGRVAKFTSPVLPITLTLETAQFINDTRKVKGDAQQTADDVQKILDKLRADPGTILPLNEALTNLDKLAAKLRGGDKEAQKLAGSVEEVRRQLQEGEQVAPFKNVFNIELPPDLKSGAPGKEAGRATIDALQQELSGAKLFGLASNAFENLIRGIKSGGAGAVDAAAEVGRNIVTQLSNQLAGLDEALNVQIAKGSQTGQIRVLKKRAENLQKIIDQSNEALRNLGPKEAGRATAIKQRRKAQADLAQTNERIRSIEQSIANDAEQAQNKREADAKAAKQKIQAARDKADQAVFDSFAPAQQRIDLASISADATKTLKDDITVQKMIANEASREIAIIEATVKNQKDRADAIRDRVKTLKSAAARLDQLRADFADAVRTRAQAARDLVTETLSKRLQLAQLIGNRDPILAAFNALIANERKNLAAAKKAKKGVLDAQIALQTTIKDRNDFLDQLKKDAGEGVSKATTAFDLLKEFADTFNQNAGNLIGPNQPFAGPTGFTADIAQFLVRRPGAKTTAAPSAKTPIELNDDRLVRSLDRLTDAIERRGNVSTGTGITVPVLPRNRRMFVEAHQVREAVEARSGV